MAAAARWIAPEWVAADPVSSANLRLLETRIDLTAPLDAAANGSLRELSGWRWFQYKIGWNSAAVDLRVRMAVGSLLGCVPADGGTDVDRVRRLCFDRLAQLSHRQFRRDDDLPEYVATILKAGVLTAHERAQGDGPARPASPAWLNARAEIRLAMRLRCPAVQLAGGNSLWNWITKDAGTTGVYFLKDRAGHNRGVFKPVDEQTDNSPKWPQRVKYALQTGRFAPQCLRPQGQECLPHRGAPVAEAAAWQLLAQLPDLGNVTMAETHLTALSGAGFYQTEHKWGSLSLFAHDAREAGAADEGQVPERAAYIDALAGGLDRKIGSYMRRDDQWVMIDFGASFPDRPPIQRNSRRNMFLWRDYRPFQAPWTPELRAWHRANYARHDQREAIIANLTLLSEPQQQLLRQRWAAIDASMGLKASTPRHLAEQLRQPTVVNLARAGDRHGLQPAHAR